MKIAYLRRREYEWTDERMMEEATNKGIELVPMLYSFIRFSNNHILYNDSPIGEMAAYYFRAVGSDFDTVSMILNIIAGAPIVDEYLTIDGVGARAKHIMHERLDALDILFPQRQLFDTFDDVRVENYPAILKYDIGGRRGTGTFLLMGPPQIDRVHDLLAQRRNEGISQSSSPCKPMLVEEYIPNSGDYRAMVVNYKCIGVTKRRPKDNLLVMNTSSGKSKRFHNNRWPKDIGTIAERAARAMNVQVAGVDLVRHLDTNEIYVIEVNEAPSFNIFELRTKVNVAGIIIDFLMDLGTT